MQHSEPLLNERANTHGDIRDNADCYFDLCGVVVKHGGAWLKKHPRLCYPLDMILMKLSRIITGDCTFDDHWIDLAGYADLGRKLSHE